MAKKRKPDLTMVYWSKKCVPSEKLLKYIKSCGEVGELFWTKVLDMTFGKKGYFYEFESIDKLVESILIYCNIERQSPWYKFDNPKGYIKFCLEQMLKHKLLDKKMFDKGILTSWSIQLAVMIYLQKMRRKERPPEEVFGDLCLISNEEWLEES